MRAFNKLQHYSPGQQLFFAVFVAVCSYFIFFFIGVLTLIPFWGGRILSDPTIWTDYSKPENVNVLKYIQLMQSVGLFIVPSFIIAFLFGDKVKNYLQLNRRSSWLSFLLLFFLIIVMNPIINVLSDFNLKLTLPEGLSFVTRWMRSTEDSAALITQTFLKVNGVSGLLWNLFVIGIIPALGEELLFRGVIQTQLAKIMKNHHYAIWISAALFSAMHMQFYGFLPRMVLGAMFGYLLVWSGSLWLPIVAHLLNNSMAILFYYMNSKGITKLNIEQFGTQNHDFPLVIVSVVVTVLLLLEIYHIEHQRQETTNKLRNT